MKLHTLAIALTVSVPLAVAYVGDMTYYTPSRNSCGITAAGTEDVVALSKAMMGNGANPNNNPKCGTKISIWNPVSRTLNSATVVDTCVGCAMYDIDVSPSLFTKVAPAGDGRVKGVDWGGPSVGG